MFLYKIDPGVQNDHNSTDVFIDFGQDNQMDWRYREGV